MGLAFEWTIRAGDILTFLGGICFAAGFLYTRGGSDATVKLTLKVMTDDLAEMKKEFRQFSETLQKVSVQEMQISLLMKWYDELRRGKGIVHED